MTLRAAPTYSTYRPTRSLARPHRCWQLAVLFICVGALTACHGHAKGPHGGSAAASSVNQSRQPGASISLAPSSAVSSSPAPSSTVSSVGAPALIVTPTSAQVGQEVHLTATGCPSSAEPGGLHGVFEDSAHRQNGPATPFVATYQADGNASGTFAIPSGSALGQAVVGIQCDSEAGNAIAYITIVRGG
jgi:hypothetical protein